MNRLRSIPRRGSSSRPASAAPSAAPSVFAVVRTPIAGCGFCASARSSAPSSVNNAPDRIAAGSIKGSAYWMSSGLPEPKARPARRLDDRGNRVGILELRVAGVQIGDPAGEPIFSGPALSQEASDVMPCVIRHHLSFCRSGAPPCPTRMTIQTTRLMNGIEGALIGR